jgi:hypothetical protein
MTPFTPTIQSARRTLAISFGAMSLLGGSLLFIYWSNSSMSLAIGRSALFILIMAVIHFVGFRLWQHQQSSVQAEVKVPVPTDSDKSLRSAIAFGLIVQIILLIFSNLILDGGETQKLCAIGLIAYWMGVVTVFFKRQSSPLKTDLLYYRWGPLGLALLAPWIAKLVYLIIGKSTESGLSRLLHI